MCILFTRVVDGHTQIDEIPKFVVRTFVRISKFRLGALRAQRAGRRTKEILWFLTGCSLIYFSNLSLSIASIEFDDIVG